MTIEFSSPEPAFHRVGDFVTGAMAEVLSESEKDSGYRSHHAGGAERLQLFEIRAPADARFEAHAHAEDEIILVVEGELRAGSQVVPAGGSMYVTGGTVYSFRAGPDGLRFFNFRPRADGTYLTPAEALERRRTEADAGGT
jgi:hypothetical protein